jgi:ABC-type polar amino acid transport system ATPase subunit
MPSALDPKTVARILEAKEALRRLEETAIVFVHKNPTILFTRTYNADKQAMMELVFSERNVENPEARKEKLRSYVC